MFDKSNLGIKVGIGGHHNKMIDGVQAKADGIELFVCGKLKRKMHLKWSLVFGLWSLIFVL